MEKVFVIAILTVALFCLAKMVEMKYLDQDVKPLKFLVRDSIIVFGSTLASAYIFLYMNSSITDFFNVVTENKILTSETTQIFTGVPEF
jgi:hypothetical protein